MTAGGAARRPGRWWGQWWGRWWGSWLFPPIPAARIAWLRILAYGFLPFDMLLLTRSTLSHAELPADLYQPVMLARLVHLPAPTPGAMYALLVVTLAAGLVAAAGRLPRPAGLVAAVGYLWWVTISMSYGKVDHDHLPLVIALFALPTAGRARIGDRSPAEAAGWAVRCIQMAAVSTYFLAAWAKMRVGGPGWPNGETLQWALTRRGTPLGRSVAEQDWLLKASQWVTIVAEFGSPALLFLRGRPLYALVLFYAGFHVITYAMMTIHFLPHAIFLAAFLPLERLSRRPAPAEPAQPAERTGAPAARTS